MACPSPIFTFRKFINTSLKKDNVFFFCCLLALQIVKKLEWRDQVNKSINKAKKAYHAINLIRKYFNCDELKGLVTSNYYSILYYNSEIWHLPSLSPNLKQKML